MNKLWNVIDMAFAAYFGVCIIGYINSGNHMGIIFSTSMVLICLIDIFRRSCVDYYRYMSKYVELSYTISVIALVSAVSIIGYKFYQKHDNINLGICILLLMVTLNILYGIFKTNKQENPSV